MFHSFFVPNRLIWKDIKVMVQSGQVLRDDDDNLVLAPDDEANKKLFEEQRREIEKQAKDLMELNTTISRVVTELRAVLGTNKPVLDFLEEITQSLNNIELIRAELHEGEISVLRSQMREKDIEAKALVSQDQIFKGWDASLAAEEKALHDLLGILLSFREELSKQKDIDQKQWEIITGGFSRAAEILKKLQNPKGKDEGVKKTPDQIRVEESRNRNKLSLDTVKVLLEQIIQTLTGKKPENVLETPVEQIEANIQSNKGNESGLRGPLISMEKANKAKADEIEAAKKSINSKLKPLEDKDRDSQVKIVEKTSSLNALVEKVSKARTQMDEIKNQMRGLRLAGRLISDTRTKIEQMSAPYQVLTLSGSQIEDFIKSVIEFRNNIIECIKGFYVDWNSRARVIMTNFPFTKPTHDQENELSSLLEALGKMEINASNYLENPEKALEDYYFNEDKTKIRLIEPINRAFTLVLPDFETRRKEIEKVNMDDGLRLTITGILDPIKQEYDGLLKSVHAAYKEHTEWFQNTAYQAEENGQVGIVVNRVTHEQEETLKSNLDELEKYTMEQVLLPLFKEFLLPAEFQKLETVKAGKNVEIELRYLGDPIRITTVSVSSLIDMIDLFIDTIYFRPEHNANISVTVRTI